MVAGMKALQVAAVHLCKGQTIRNLLIQNGTRWLPTSSEESPLCRLQGQYPSVMLVRGMAGHSQWQNRKNIKEKNDLIKSNLFNKHCLLIRKAAQFGNGGANPKLNTELATAIQAAKKINMPSSTIEKVLKKLTNPDLKPGEIELIGPGGCLLLLEVETDNLNRTIHDVRNLLKKSKLGMITKDGRGRNSFTTKGIARLSGKKDGSKLDAEVAMDDAILADAEEVQESTDDEGNPILMFVSSREDFGKMMRWLNESDYVVLNSGLEYVARNPVELSDDVMDSAWQLCNQLEELSEVVRVNVNIK